MLKELRQNTFIKGAIIITVSLFIAKAIGGIYKLPLMSVLGSEGMGFFQFSFSVYCMFLLFSSGAVSSTVSALVSSKKRECERIEVLKKSLIIFLSLSALLAILMSLFSRLFSSVQGSEGRGEIILSLVPSVILSCALSCLRGYFQGTMNMLPTAFSEVGEQVFKMAFGLYFAFLYRGDVIKSVFWCLFSVNISQSIVLVFMILYFFNVEKNKIKPLYNESVGDKKIRIKDIFAFSLPLVLSGAIIPVSVMAESFIIVKFIPLEKSLGQSLYGLYSGAAMSVISIPASISYGISVSVIPQISKSGKKKGKSLCLFSLLTTLFIALPSAVYIFLFSEQIVSLLFPSLSVNEADVLSRLIKILSPSACLTACVQTLSAALTGMGRPQTGMKNLIIGCSVKLILDMLLIPIKKINISGAAVAYSCSYFVAFILNLVYIIDVNQMRFSLFGVAKIAVSTAVCAMFSYLLPLNIVFKIIFGGAVYLMISAILKPLTKKEQAGKGVNNVCDVGRTRRLFTRYFSRSIERGKECGRCIRKNCTHAFRKKS